MPFDTQVPRDVFELALVLFLSFLVGLEREEHKAHAGHYVFGGVRTFPLLGFVGYALARLSTANLLALGIGLAVVGSLMSVSYWHKVRADPTAGATTEISALLTYVLGALVCAGAYWTAVALGVIAVLLLELREALERLTAKVAREEVLAFTKFLLLAIVILPVLPDRPLTRFAINPFDVWLVIVAVSGLSYASYALQRWLKQRGGLLATGLLGGAYSSTATTIVLARQGREAVSARLVAGSTLAASGVMYVRLLVLILLFRPAVARTIAASFGALAALAIACGALLALPRLREPAADAHPKNPLELRPAFVFGVAFLATLVVARLTLEHVGRGGLYALAVAMGFGDIDPFVLGVTRSAGVTEPVQVLGASIVIAAAANNVAKAIYARIFGAGRAANLSVMVLLAFAALGLVPLAYTNP